MIVTLILILACQIHGTKESLDISSIYKLFAWEWIVIGQNIGVYVICKKILKSVNK